MAGYTIPDEAEAAFAPQARLFQTDLEILALAHGASGVISGCAVTAQGSPDMTVAVAAGVVKSLGTRLTVAGGNATITTADGTNPRLDVVVVTSANALAVRAGTAAVSPLLPALTAGDVALARVYVPASDTTMATNQIVDARVLLAEMTPARDTVVGTTSAPTTTSTTYVDFPEMSVTVTPIGTALLAILDAVVGHGTLGGNVFLAFSLDGAAEVGEKTESHPVANFASDRHNHCLFEGLTPGVAYTIKARWKVNAGTGSGTLTYRTLTVTEG